VEFLIGFSLLLLLLIQTFLVTKITKNLPAEAMMLPLVIMIVVDLFLAGFWFFSMRELFDNVKVFKLGISMAFMVAAFGRATYFYIDGLKE
jgi:hypothetical protein